MDEWKEGILRSRAIGSLERAFNAEEGKDLDNDKLLQLCIIAKKEGTRMVSKLASVHAHEGGKAAAVEERGLQVIRRVSLRDMAMQHIREAIERGELKAGEVLTELGLARKLGVGQPTIREALIELEFLGFIERMGPRKTRVTLLTRRAIDDIYLVRGRLEVLAVELVVRQKTSDLSDCWNQVRRMERAAETGRAIEFYQADLAFHRSLWKETGNESLRNCLEQLVPRLMTFSIIQQVHPTAEKLTEIASVHRQLLGMIEGKDLEASRKCMEQSMENAWLDDTQLPGIN
jgi:DNA-binding GntR family transcriptional regulator